MQPLGLKKTSLDVMDMLNIVSFCVGVQNLDENLTQNDMSELLGNAIEDVHYHLAKQDQKLDLILQRLEALENDQDKGFSRSD